MSPGYTANVKAVGLLVHGFIPEDISAWLLISEVLIDFIV